VRDRLLLLRVLGLLWALRVLLPRVRLDTLLARLTPHRHPTSPDGEALDRAVRHVDGHLWRFRFGGPGPCLPRTVALFYFATRCGYPVVAHCGVRRLEGRLGGHAWLSLGGAPFLEVGDPGASYTVTFSYPRPDAPAAAASRRLDEPAAREPT
jgi:hypothetical protein